MNKSLKVALVISGVVLLGVILCYFFTQAKLQNEQVGIKECPDEKIVNRMPGPGSSESSYYIVDGQRREISEYDSVWVSANCTVPVQEVY
jgi:hypothetical protein